MTGRALSTAKSGLTYKKLPDSTFIFTAIFLQVSLIIVSISVNSIEFVFEVLGAVASSCITFLFPGLAYLVALRRYGKSSDTKKWQTLFNQITAWFFLFMFIVTIGTFIYLEILKANGAYQSTKSASEEAISDIQENLEANEAPDDGITEEAVVGE